MTINTKYNINDKVWLLYANKGREGEITGFRYQKANNMCHWNNIKEYCVNLLPDAQLCIVEESLLFSTKEELIASL